MSWIEELWRSLKMTRKLAWGQVALEYRFARHVPVSDNRRREGRPMSPWIGAAPTGGAAAPPAGDASDAPGKLPALAPDLPSPASVETALVVGVGPGLGHALAATLAKAGMQVALASRNAERLDALAASISRETDRTVRAYGCDATDERQVAELLTRVAGDLGVPDLVIYSLQYFENGRSIELDVSAFELAWRHNCLGGFIVAREAARRMLPLHRGSILLVGSTSSLIGREDHLALSVGKFGLRSVAQVMARELGPEGIHVAHFVIDADIQEDAPDPLHPTQALPQDIAASMLAIHRQPRSCWTSEIDARPWNERFWQHC